MIESCSSNVYVFGSAAGGALGCQDLPASVELVPRQLAKCCTDLSKQETGIVTNIVAGNGVTTLITSNNEAYSWGDSSLKNCAVKGKRGTSCQCNRIPLHDIIDVAHGANHSIVVTKHNSVYGWGEMSHYSRSKSASLAAASSQATTRKVTKPRKLPIDINQGQTQKRLSIKQVGCGNGFSCIVKTDGTLIVIGQIGIGTSTALNNIRFKEISCGQNHIAAICNFQRVYTWGWGKNGRLGHGDDQPRNEPMHVKSLDKLELLAAACGYAHTLVASDDGSVFGFGWNCHNQVLGAAEINSDDCLSPVMCLEKKGVVKISCGFAHSAAITSNGSICTWGMNDDGQCGTGQDINVPMPTLVEIPIKGTNRYVVDVSCGHSHTVCIVSNYSPTTWTIMIDRLRLRPFAAAVIVRFARCALFRTRLFDRIRAKNAALESTPPSPTEITGPDDSYLVIDDDVSEQTKESDMESSLSSHTSLSNNFDEAVVEKDDDLARRLIEMSRMSDKDLRSQAYTAHLRAIQAKKLQKRKLAAELKRVNAEQVRMMQEDMISQQVRKQRKGKIKSTKTSAMNAKANDHIQKAADRLRAARERKESQTKAKVALPAVARKIASTKKQGNRSNRSAITQVTNNNKAELPEGHLHRRHKLLLRRERRLKTKESQEREADIAKRHALKDKQERDKLESQMRQKQLDEEKKLIEEAKISKRRQRMVEIQKLENELRMKDSLQALGGENKENEREMAFRSLTHWTRNLYGQK